MMRGVLGVILVVGLITPASALKMIEPGTPGPEFTWTEEWMIEAFREKYGICDLAYERLEMYNKGRVEYDWEAYRSYGRVCINEVRKHEYTY